MYSFFNIIYFTNWFGHDFNCVCVVVVRLSSETRPGVCPSTNGAIGSCVEACEEDGDCEFGQKCCSNGCGHVCVEPLPGIRFYVDNTSSIPPNPSKQLRCV